MNMKTNFGLRNFRLFDNNGARIEIKPITIVTGGNGSGKSSITKAIYMLSDFLRQGITSYKLNGTFKLQDCKFDFNAENMKLGRFENVINVNSDEKSFELQYEVFPNHLCYRVFLVKLKFSVDKESVLHNARLSEISINLNDNDLTCIMNCSISEKKEIKYKSGNLLELSSDFSAMLLMLYWQCGILESEELSNVYGGTWEDDSDFADFHNEVKDYITRILNGMILPDDRLRKLVKKENGVIGIDFLKDYKKIWPAAKLMFDTKILLYLPVLNKFKTMTKEEVLCYLTEIYADYKNTDACFSGKLLGLSYLPDVVEDFKKSEEQNFINYYRRKENQSGLIHKNFKDILRLSNYSNDIIDEFTYGYLSCDYDSNGFSGIIQSGEDEKGSFGRLFSAMAALQVKEGDSDRCIDMVDEMDYYSVSSIMYNSYLKFVNIVLHEVLMPEFLRDFVYVGSTRVNVSRLYSFDDKTSGFPHLIEAYFKNKSRYKKPWGVNDGYNPGDFMNKWLKQLEIADGISLEGVQDGFGAVVYLIKGESRSLLADEGYGITQMVAILMNIENEILNNKNRRNVTWPIGDTEEYLPTIAFEEPELSLHPKLQSKLAEIFYDANTNYGIDFIIETHSEYLVRKTQIIVAHMEAKELNPFSVIYAPFAQKPYNMEYLEDGRFAKPFGAGFFDEADNLAMELFFAKK